MSDPFSLPLLSAADLAAMTPEERQQAHEERLVTDLSIVPAELREALLGDDATVVARGEAIRARRAAAEQARTTRQRAS